MKDLLSIIGTFGIGAIISSYFTLLWQQKNKESEAKQNYKEKRYKCIVLLMKASIDFERYKDMLNQYDYKINDKGELFSLLKDEQLSSLLYASNGFIKSFGIFIKNPTNKDLITVVNEMRKDLWK